MRSVLFAAMAAIIALGVAAPSHAQKAKASNTSNTTSGAVAGAEAIVPGALGGVPGGGAGAAAAASATAGFNQPQLIMNSTNAPSTGTFNDCGVAWSGAIWLISASSTSESKECVAQREAIFAASILGDKALAFERMCDNEMFRKAAARRQGQQCAATVEEQRIADSKRPQPTVVQPVSVPTQRVAASDPCGGRGIASNVTQRDGSQLISCN